MSAYWPCVYHPFISAISLSLQSESYSMAFLRLNGFLERMICDWPPDCVYLVHSGKPAMVPTKICDRGDINCPPNLH
jgi:hypothetical protein